MLANMPFLTGIFLAPPYVPLALLQGLMHGMAAFNPVTPLLDGARNLVAGEYTGVPLALFVSMGLVLVVSVISARTLVTASRQG